MTDEMKIVSDLRWFVRYYPKWNNENPCQTMEKAADTIEVLLNVLGAKDRMLAGCDLVIRERDEQLEKTQRELDALKEDLMLVAGDASFCEICKQHKNFPCRGHIESDCFEWRGVQEDAE